MDVITTHINADFDALGSMLAARRLYPEAHLVFPGGQEKSLRDFFVRSAVASLPVERAKDVDLGEVGRLILVDCRQRSRIGRFAEVAGRPGVEVVVYDHHPPSEDDVRATEEHVEPTGSTLAILCRLLRERGVRLDPHEATIMAMGIYEDTGSLTFISTTEADYLAAAYLRGQGADLALVAELMNRTLSSRQIFLLSDLIRNLRRHRVHGLEIATTEAGVGAYVDDLAVLVHRLVEIENLPAVFALFAAEERITLIARSRVPEIDAGAVARLLGGGGHPTAAAAGSKDATAPQAREMVLDAIHGAVRAPLTARRMMTYPPRTIEAARTIGEARELVTRHDVNTLLVVQDGELRGLLTRQNVDKAVHHGLAGDEVEGYMSANFRAVGPDDPFAEVYGIMISGRQPVVPVVEDGRPVGLVTRADFLRQLRDEEGRDPDGARAADALAARPELRKDVARALKAHLPAATLERLRELGREADAMGFPAYLVGGIARDLLLDIPNADVDVVVEGDAIALAERFGAPRGCHVTTHERFGTAVLRFPDGTKIDAATARTEYYDRPAALPIVEASSLKLDLFRRDFTINTLVVSLAPKAFGQLLDFFGAYRDLREGTVRVLHNLSFIEDPTRILRAVRFEKRFGFTIGRQTSRLMAKAVQLRVLERLAGPRLFTELRIQLEEAEPVPALVRLAELGVLEQVHPALKMTRRVRAVLDETVEVLSWWKLAALPVPCEFWRVHLYALIALLRSEEAASFCERLGLTGARRARVLRDKEDAERALARLSRRPRLTPSVVYRALEGLSIEARLLAMAKTYREPTRRAIAASLARDAEAKPLIAGRDLKALGVPPGPLYGEVLARVLDARLDGKVRTKAEELALARRMLRKAGAAGG